MRRIADVLGDSSLTVARAQAEYSRLVASLVFGVTSPGALVSMYIPEAGVEFPAPGIQIPANVNGPALTLVDQAQLRYFSTLFRRPQLLASTTSWLRERDCLPKGHHHDW